MNAASSIFHPDGNEKKPVLSFSIRKVSVKRYDAMTPEQRKHALEWIGDCEKYLKRFKQNLLNPLPNGK